MVPLAIGTGERGLSHSAALRLRGGLDIVALQRSFERLAQRHESLRTRFRQEGLRTVQVVDADGQLQVSGITWRMSMTRRSGPQSKRRWPGPSTYGRMRCCGSVCSKWLE